MSKPAVRRALMVTVGMMFLQQLSGINNVFNFSSTFLKQECAEIPPRSPRAVATRQDAQRTA